MKILLQINSVVNSGSTGKIAEEIGQIATDHLWQSYIAYGRGNRHSKSRLIKIGNNWDIKLHGIYTRLFDKHGFGSEKATLKLIKQIKEIKPDIIHLHNIHGYYINIKALFLFLKTSEIPVIWTLHDCWPFTGHCAYFDYVNCEKWKTVCNNCPQKREYPSSIGFDGSKRNYYLKKELFTSIKNITFVPVSMWLEKIVKQSFLFDSPIQVINNGIDLKTFQPFHDMSIREKYNLKEEFIILGVASVWSQRKGFIDFIKLNKLLDHNYKIILVGLQEKDINKLPEGIIGISKTESKDDLALIYSNADVFVNPTWEDNFPTTNIEALACGTPVITYKTGGSPEAINSETGFVVEKGNINDVFSAIEIIKEKGRNSYITACRQRALKLYNKDDRYFDYLKLYESIINNKIE